MPVAVVSPGRHTLIWSQAHAHLINQLEDAEARVAELTAELEHVASQARCPSMLRARQGRAGLFFFSPLAVRERRGV